MTLSGYDLTLISLSCSPPTCRGLVKEVELCAHTSEDDVSGKNILVVLFLFTVMLF